MSAALTEPQDQRNKNGTEDSPAMTIEFLCARLLSERSVSRAAKQRAYELSSRVTELEEQLKIVSLQRKKAEKATLNVLAILEEHGISDESEMFDSSSDQDKSNHGNGEETSDSIRVGDLPAYSSSEIEFSPSIGRSLSWKNSKHSLNSFERNNFMDSPRRKCTKSASFGSSPKRVGKSCRRIRRRDIRPLVEGSQKDSNCNEIEPRALEGDDVEDMEGALHNQEQLIGRYVAEEKAQREWEEKFTHNITISPNLYDPGNHSDLTEEKDDVPATVRPRAALSPEEVKAPENPVPPPHIDIINSPEINSSNIIAHETPVPNSEHTSSPIHTQSTVSSDIENTSQKSSKMTIVPLGTTDRVESVLDALQKAKLSLKHKVDGSPRLESESSQDRLEIPPGCPGLFRLPIDINYERSNSLTSRTSLLSDFKSSDAGLLDDLQGYKGLPFTSKSIYPCYPFLPDVTPQLALNNKDVHVSLLDDHKVGIPPSTRIALYDHNIKPNLI